jgi:1-aminocyclopropane-1-carboxylate deaminase/D-cysteine desulfhydrase-like pyridoxal-dependent ACC family enzyme
MTGDTGQDAVLRAPRFPLGALPTPLRPATRLAEHVGARTPLLVKRDDLAGFVTAGSKVRPLELLVGHALERGYDTLVTAGVAASSFCQGAATAARMAGLRCHLLLPGEPAGTVPANLAMALACGAEVTYTGRPRERLEDLVREHAAELTRSGHHAMGVPRGGADDVGALGFVLAAAELADQLRAEGIGQARIVIAVGSGGSVSGLLVGRSRCRLDWTVTGVSVSRPLPGLEEHLASLVTRCAARAEVDDPGTSALTLVASRGRAHGPADSEELACAALALRTEGLLLDDAYTARSGLVATQLCRTPGPPVVLWHTGGLVRAVTAYDRGEQGDQGGDQGGRMEETR